MTTYKKIVLAAVACLAASVSQAAITNVSAIGVPNSLPGYVTTDIFITFDGQYYGSQLYLNGLLPGQVYQVPSISVPIPFVDPIDPRLPPSFPSFDTFLTQGALTSEGLDGAIGFGGGAVDLGAPATAQFDSDGINQSWNPSPGYVIVDRTDFMVARITLSDQANGMLFYMASAGGEISPPQLGPIVNGTITFVPEPSTTLMVLLGTVGMTVSSHRQRC